MLRFVGGVLDPDRYHGGGRIRRPYFEGWYYKLVSEAGGARKAVIPGIFFGQDPGADHCFIQTLDGITGRSTYHRYPAESFEAAPDRFDLRLGDSRFTAHGIELAIDDAEARIAGTLRFPRVQPWPVRWRAPGVMGWYAWVPRMECYHGVVSLDHAIEGSLDIDGKKVGFDGGRGYTEKDWGTAFPSAYVWMQSNHFAEAGTSLSASVARIPWRRSAFRGFIVGLWHRGQLHRFTTYVGARIEHLAIDDHHVAWTLRSRSHRLALRAARAEGGLLHSPVRTEMHRRVEETLRSSIEVRLSRLGTGAGAGSEEVVFEGTGQCAGLEVHGDLPRLLER